MIAATAPMAPAVSERRYIGVYDAILSLLALALACSAGYRLMGPGRDYLEYARFYIQLGSNFDPFASRFEPGFTVVAWVMGQWLGLSYETFMTTLALVALAIKFYLFRRYLTYPALAALIYILIFYPIHEYTQIRAAIGISFGFLAIHHMIEGKRILAAAMLVLGALFHYSIIILGIVAVGSLFLQSLRARIILLTLSAILVVFSEPIGTYVLPYFTGLNPLLEGHFYNMWLDEAVNLLALSNLLLMLTILTMAAVGMSGTGRYRNVFLSLSIVAFASLAFFANSPVLAQRTKEMLLVALIFLVFRAPIRSLIGAVPVFLLGISGLWIFFRYFDEGLLGA